MSASGEEGKGGPKSVRDTDELSRIEPKALTQYRYLCLTFVHHFIPALAMQERCNGSGIWHPMQTDERIAFDHTKRRIS
jgi:hypothetical protein